MRPIAAVRAVGPVVFSASLERKKARASTARAWKNVPQRREQAVGVRYGAATLLSAPARGWDETAKQLPMDRIEPEPGL
jgi:hypothetical protein